MKFKIDENLPAEFAAVLGEAGFEAATVVEERLSGTTDSALLERCRTEERVLVTLDLDFANVQSHPPGTHSGIIVFREQKPRQADADRSPEANCSCIKTSVSIGTIVDRPTRPHPISRSVNIERE